MYIKHWKTAPGCSGVQWGAVVRVVWVQSNLHGTTSVEGHFQLVAAQQKYICMHCILSECTRVLPVEVVKEWSNPSSSRRLVYIVPGSCL